MTDSAPTSPRQPVSAEKLAGHLKCRVQFQNNFLTAEEWLDIATVAAEAYRSASLPVTPEESQQSERVRAIERRFANANFHGCDGLANEMLALIRELAAPLPVQQAQHSAKLQELVSYAQKHFHWQDIPGRWVFDGELGTLLKLIVDLRGPLAVIPRIKDEGAAPSTPPASSPQTTFPIYVTNNGTIASVNGIPVCPNCKHGATQEFHHPQDCPKLAASSHNTTEGK